MSKQNVFGTDDYLDREWKPVIYNNRECRICHKPKDLQELRFEPEDTEANEEFSLYVCGTCWDIIATIAKRIAIATFNTKISLINP